MSANQRRRESLNNQSEWRKSHQLIVFETPAYLLYWSCNMETQTGFACVQIDKYLIISPWRANLKFSLVFRDKRGLLSNQEYLFSLKENLNMAVTARQQFQFNIEKHWTHTIAGTLTWYWINPHTELPTYLYWCTFWNQNIPLFAPFFSFDERCFSLSNLLIIYFDSK